MHCAVASLDHVPTQSCYQKRVLRFLVNDIFTTSWRNSLYHQMYIVQKSGMRHLAAPSCGCSVYESLLCLRCKKTVVVGKWIFNTSNVYASQTSRWNCCIFFGIVAYFFLLLHTFFYCCINFFTVAVYFLLLYVYFYCWSSFFTVASQNCCCHRKVIVACKWPFWATVIYSWRF